MLGLKKRDIKKALKAGAKMGGVSFADVRADIEATIDRFQIIVRFLNRKGRYFKIF